MAREALRIAGGRDPHAEGEASNRPREEDKLVTRHPFQMIAAGFVQESRVEVGKAISLGLIEIEETTE